MQVLNHTNIKQDYNIIVNYINNFVLMRLHTAYNYLELRNHIYRFYDEYYNKSEINSLLQLIEMFNLQFIDLNHRLSGDLNMYIILSKLNIAVIDFDFKGVSDIVYKESIFTLKHNLN